jgi:hypothetical protein
MAPKKRPAASVPIPEPDDDLYSKLVSCGSKTGLVEAIGALSKCGWLQPAVTDRCAERTVRSRLSDASKKHCDAVTPYGTVVQSMSLDSQALPSWNFAHPLAYLYYLSTISAQFGELMRRAITPGVPLRLILYVDEICPGNPLRPEKSRTLQAIYWAILDWPQSILQRTAAWPTFGTIRAKVVDKLAGGLPAVMKLVLQVFFATNGPSFDKGVQIVCGKENILATARFSGFLADEKALSQVADTKGAAGTKCCMDCNNVYNRVSNAAIHRVEGSVGIDCTDMSKLRRTSDNDFFACYDYLEVQRAILNDTQYDSVSQRLGIKVNQHGLMGCRALRNVVYKPVTHNIRDWMHTLVSNGVANVQCARLLHFMVKRLTFKLDPISAFVVAFVLPQRFGKTHPSWVSKKRLGKGWKSLTSFSGEMLSLLPILECFLVDVDDPESALHPHVVCFQLLCAIVGILGLGPDDCVPFVPQLTDLIAEHGALFVELYGEHVKPKFHHFRHLPETIDRLQKCVSCFVTERKHRLTKRMALFTFRHIDNTVIKSMVNKQCTQLAGDANLFNVRALARPRRVNFAGTEILQAKEALLPSGTIRKDDVVVLRSGEAARTISFWGVGDNVSVELQMYKRVSDTKWEVTHGDDMKKVVDVERVVDAVAYAELERGIIRVLLPARVKLALA